MEYSDDDLLLIMFTGGTTGRSKGVMLRNRQVFCNTVHEALDTEMNERDNTILATPLHHSAALNCWLLPHLYLGACATIMTEYSAKKMADMIERHKVTNGFAPPSMARELCQVAEAAPHKLATFRRWYIGGGVLVSKDRDRIHALVPGSKIFYQYGLTEAGPIVTVLKEEDCALAADSIGRPFVNFEVKIASVVDLTDVPLGESGEILVRGPSVMDGYFERPDATDTVFHDGWLRTGDTGAMDKNGFVYFHDRLKDMVKTGGLNVYSQEVERALQKFPAVQEVAVIGLPSEKWGEEVVAVVVPRSGATVLPEELIAFAKANLAPYKAPKRVIVIPYEELPINYSGKIVKRVLRTRLRERFITEEGTLS
jgi:fatty-acyl-CoA synthase